MSNKQPYQNSPSPNHFNGGAPKYINDFSKALASEVRILLEEVGKLRDERRALQFEIAELMAMKSKHGAGGEYSPNWTPKAEEPPPPTPVLEAPPSVDDEPLQARPGWRTVHQKRQKMKQITAAAAPPTPKVAPIVVPPDPPAAKLPAWAQWRPNPQIHVPVAQAPTPPPPMSVPQRSGLFGPSTPPPS